VGQHHAVDKICHSALFSFARLRDRHTGGYIPGWVRLFEVVQKVKEINAQRQAAAPGCQFQGSSSNDTQLKEDSALALDYIVAPPQMAHYMEASAEIYQVYLKYIAPEDIHVYS